MTYPRISVEGAPGERGRQYGEATRPKVRRSLDAYREVFAHYAGWNWDRVRAEAERFRAPIEEYDPRYLEEIAGIAAGAGVAEVDVLALNVRTEVMFGATARDAGETGKATERPAECTSFAVMPERTGDGRMLIGQNWDWLCHAAETTVVLEARQDDGPNWVTVVEAGLLAKIGMNSAGVGLLANALVTDRDSGPHGVPFHVLLRAILDSETISDALVALQRAIRASSANYLVAHEDALAIDIETAPGDFSKIWLGHPQDGVIMHSNHFLNPGFDARDVSVFAMPCSPFRLQRFGQLVNAQHGAPLDLAFCQRALCDHSGFPLSLCYHPDPRREAAPEREQTVASLIMDVADRRMWLASGNPCRTAYQELDYSELLSKPSPVRDAPAR